MESKYILEKSSVGTRIGGADFNCRTGRSVLRDTRVSMVEKSGSMPVCTHRQVLYTFVTDGGSAAEAKTDRTSPKGNGLPPDGRILNDMEKVSSVKCVRTTSFAAKSHLCLQVSAQIKSCI